MEHKHGNGIHPRQIVQNVPQTNKTLRDDARQKDVTQIFTAWDGLISSGRATVKNDLVATVVTVTDTLWKEKIPYDENPIRDDPVFQRQIVTTQIVPSTVPRQKNSQTVVKTVGGRSLVIKTDSQDVTTVNDVPVIDFVTSGDSEILILDKLLFIRPEDIELAVGRVRGSVK